MADLGVVGRRWPCVNIAAGPRKDPLPSGLTGKQVSPKRVKVALLNNGDVGG